MRFYSFQFNNLTTIFDFVTNSVISTNGGTSPSITSESYGNDWYRVIISDTTTAINLGVSTMLVKDDNSFNYTGDGTSGVYLYGFQVEQVATYPTSYIPTYGTSQTRLKDVCSKTGVSSLIGQTEGTIFAEFTPSSDVNTEVLQLLATTSIQNAVSIGIGAGQIYGVVFTNSSYVANFTISQTIPNNTFKVALCYKNNDITFFINGQKVASNTNAYSGQADFTKIFFNEPLFFGRQSVSYKKTLIFKSKLSDDECIELTTI